MTTKNEILKKKKPVNINVVNTTRKKLFSAKTIKKGNPQKVYIVKCPYCNFNQQTFKPHNALCICCNKRFKVDVPIQASVTRLSSKIT